jgi:hypothetical protein
MRQLPIWNVDRPETRELAGCIRKVVDEFGDDKVLGIPATRGPTWSPSTSAPTQPDWACPGPNRPTGC